MADPSRTYARRYTGLQKALVHGFVEQAVDAAGGRVLFSSGGASAPLFLGVRDADDRPVGIMAYVFRATRRTTKNRPEDEHRGQIRYGDVNDKTWREAGHRLGFDPAAVDATVVLVVDLEAGVIFGLDAVAFDPLPLGNSVYFKEHQVQQALDTGWHPWEYIPRLGPRRGETVPELAVVVGFRPERILDFVAFEREAQRLGLDPALRYRAAETAARSDPSSPGTHKLEQDFGLSSRELLSIIERKSRLAMAMRGGVAEHHLGLLLSKDPNVGELAEGTAEGPPDFHVLLASGERVTVECKNASPTPFANGTYKVEIQKTRSSKGDPLSRFYELDAFDVVAACLYGPTRAWDFRFCRTSRLIEHKNHAGRIQPIQPIDDRWSSTIHGALAQPPRDLG